MKILVDGYVLLSAESGAGGAGRYFHSLLDEWNGMQLNIRIVASPLNYKLFSPYSNLEVVVVGKQSAWAYSPHFDWADVYYAPLNGLWPRFIPDRLPVVACIHDLQHLVSSQFFSREVWEARNKDYGFAIKRADRLVAISEYEKSNIKKYFGQNSIDVVHHSGYLSDYYDENRPTSTSKDIQALEEYAIYPAVPWPHKNHFSLIHAWKVYTEQFGGKEQLVLTGATSHDHARGGVRGVIASLGLEKKVISLGFQEDHEQAHLIGKAKALIFPSLYEGFGIPLVEAMQLGVPVCATHLDVCKEVGGDAITYIDDAKNPFQLALTISELLQNQSILQELKEKGLDRGARFSTAKMAEETLSVLKEAIQTRKKGNLISVCQENLPQYTGNSTLALAYFIRPGANESSIDKVLQHYSSVGAKIFAFIPITSSLNFINKIKESCIKHNALMRGYNDQEEKPEFRALDNLARMEKLPHYLTISIGEQDLISGSSLRAAIAELDYYTDIGIAFFRNNNASLQFSEIFSPKDERVVYTLFLKHKKNAIKPFIGSAIRTSVFNDAGMVGSLKFLGYFLKNISSIKFGERV